MLPVIVREGWEAIKEAKGRRFPRRLKLVAAKTKLAQKRTNKKLRVKRSEKSLNP
jgi:hypothetical protein